MVYEMASEYDANKQLIKSVVVKDDNKLMNERKPLVFSSEMGYDGENEHYADPDDSSTWRLAD